MRIENNMLGEDDDHKSHILYDYLYEMSRISKFTEMESRRVLLGSGAFAGRWGVTADKQRVF
jgi:hypothetical protein